MKDRRCWVPRRSYHRPSPELLKARPPKARSRGVGATLACLLLIGWLTGCAAADEDRPGRQTGGLDEGAAASGPPAGPVTEGECDAQCTGQILAGGAPHGGNVGAAGQFEAAPAANHSPRRGNAIQDRCWHDGDVDGNGRLTAGDAQLAWGVVLRLRESTPEERCAADCNGDGDVTADDVRDIFGLVLGLATCPHDLPCGEPCMADAECGCGECRDNVCSVPVICGDHTCNAAGGEGCATCPADCGACERQCLVYAAATSGVMERYRLPDGPRDELLRTASPGNFAVDPMTRAIYFTTWETGTSGQVRRLNADGTVDTLYTLRGGGQGIGLDLVGRRIFWGEYYSGLFSASMDGGEPVELVSGEQVSAHGVMGIQLDAANEVIYFFTPDNCSVSGRRIWRVNYDGSGLTQIYQAEDGLTCAYADLAAGKLYFVDLAAPQTAKTIYRTALDGSGREPLFAMPGDRYCTGLAVDSATATIYFSADDGVWRAGLDGSGLERLVDNLRGLGGVQWLTSDNDGGLCPSPMPAADCFDTTADPVPLCSCADLQRMADHLDRDFALQNDIDCTESANWNWDAEAGFLRGFAPIAGFAGRLAGNGHSIANLFIHRPDTSHVALFAHVAGATIIDLGLVDVDVTGDDQVGGLIGGGIRGLPPGHIENCHVTGTVQGDREIGLFSGGPHPQTRFVIRNCWTSGSARGNDTVGGFAGIPYESTITDCHSSAAVNGAFIAGGFVANNYGNTIARCSASGPVEGGDIVGGFGGGQDRCSCTDCFATGEVRGVNRVGGFSGHLYNGASCNRCFATGNVSGTGSDIGGFVGLPHGGMVVRNSYALGAVSGGQNVGGFVGGLSAQYGANTIENSYAAGAVTGTGLTGGFIARNLSGSHVVRNCYWDVEASGQPTSFAGIGKTTAEMMDFATFGAWSFPPWDTICEGVGYPSLAWQAIEDPAACPGAAE